MIYWSNKSLLSVLEIILCITQLIE
jgi:hypothetical protein